MTDHTETRMQIWFDQEKQFLANLVKGNSFRGYFVPDEEEVAAIRGVDTELDMALPPILFNPRTQEMVGVKLIWPKFQQRTLVELIECFQLLESAFPDHEKIKLLVLSPAKVPAIKRWLERVPGVALVEVGSALLETLDNPVDVATSSDVSGTSQSQESANLIHHAPGSVLPPPGMRTPPPLTDWAVPICPVCGVRIRLVDFVIQPHADRSSSTCPASLHNASLPSNAYKLMVIICQGCGGGTRVNAMTGMIRPHAIPNSDEPCPWGGDYIEPRHKEIPVELLEKSPLGVDEDEDKSPGQLVRRNYADRTVDSVRAFSGGLPGSRK